MLAYILATGLGSTIGLWTVVGFHRRNPGVRNVPPSYKALIVAFLGAALLLVMAWAVSGRSNVLLSGLGTFTGVLVFGHFLWPLFRSWRRDGGEAGGLNQ